MSARQTALKVLIAMEKEAGWANSLLKEQIARDGLDRRDAALATRLVYGVVQNRLRLDFYLRQVLTGRVESLRPVLRDILHLGLYQLYDMDKIPACAAINESVELARQYCKKMKNAPALVNAVLRNAQRLGSDRLEPTALSQRYSHPEGLIALFRGYLGEDALEPMLRANNEAPETVLQVNTLKTTVSRLAELLQAQGAAVRPHPWMENCLILSQSGALERLPAFQQGLFYVQDAAARLAVEAAGLKPGMCVADCCAAPGGKSFAAAIAMEGQGEIFSSDLHPHRVALIEKGARRLGLTNLQTRVCDASVPVPQQAGSMDAVLVDVPCSGYGIIRKKPDIRYKDPDSMKELPDLQLRILMAQADLARPGGVVIYATCTLVRRENEGVVEKFLKARPDFILEPIPLPEIFPENHGTLRLLPGQYDTDGFFIARLRRSL